MLTKDESAKFKQLRRALKALLAEGETDDSK